MFLRAAERLPAKTLKLHCMTARYLRRKVKVLRFMMMRIDLQAFSNRCRGSADVSEEFCSDLEDFCEKLTKFYDEMGCYYASISDFLCSDDMDSEFIDLCKSNELF